MSAIAHREGLQPEVDVDRYDVRPVAMRILVLVLVVTTACVAGAGRGKRTTRSAAPVDTTVAVQQQSALAKPVWSAPLHTPFSDVLLPRADGTVLVGGLEWDDDAGALVPADLQLMDATTGALRWKRPREGETTIVSAGDPLLVLERTTQGSHLTSIGARGETLWSTDHDRLTTMQLTTDGDLIIADAKSTQRVAAATGKGSWSSRAAGAVRLIGSVALVLGERSVALDLATGKELWSTDGVRQLVDVIDTERGYVIADSTTLRLVDRASGKALWSRAIERTTRLMPGDASGVLVVTTDAQKRAYELQWIELASGDKRWGVAHPQAPSGAPLVDRGSVVCPYPAALVRFDVRDGKQQGVARLPLAIVGEGLPDALWATGDAFYLRRELGLAAVNAETFALAWYQPILYSAELQYARFARERDRWLADVKELTPASTTYVAVRSEQDRTWSAAAANFAADARAQKERVFSNPRASYAERMDALQYQSGATATQQSIDHMNAHFDRMRSTLDAVNAVAMLAAALLQEQLDRYADSVNKDRLAMVAAATTNIATLSRYLNASATLALQPVMHREARIGLTLVDPATQRSAVVWVAPRVDNNPPLAALSPDGKQLFVVGVPPNPALHEGFVVRESVRHGLAISTFQVPELEAVEKPADTAVRQGGSAMDIELPALVLARDYKTLRQRYATLTCKALPTQTFAGGTLLDHALQAGATEVADNLQSRGYKLGKGGNKSGFSFSSALQFADDDVTSFMRTGAAKKPGRKLYVAAAAGDEKAALAALKAGADPNAGAYIPRCDFSPLHFAVFKQMSTLVDALLKAGAWVNFEAPDGTPLDLAETNRVPAAITARLKQAGAKRAADAGAR